jgi:hypothetical protein
LLHLLLLLLLLLHARWRAVLIRPSSHVGSVHLRRQVLHCCVVEAGLPVKLQMEVCELSARMEGMFFVVRFLSFDRDRGNGCQTWRGRGEVVL